MWCEEVKCSRIIEFDPAICRGYCRNPVLAESFERRWFGRRENGLLYFTMEEIAFLLLKGYACVRVSGKTYSDLGELMDEYYSCFQRMFWPRLLVYNDLRGRGRRVRVVDNEKFLVKHKDNTLRLLVVMEEKQLIKASKLYDLVLQARKNGLYFVAAIVSLQGDLTYYEISSIDLRKG